MKTKFGVLVSVLGDRSAVSIIKFLFGDEATLEIAQALDSERLSAAVTSEVSMTLRLQKAGVLLAALKTTRLKLLQAAKKVAENEGEKAPALVDYAQQIASLDRDITEFDKVVAQMTAGRETAKNVVNSIQRQVTANLIDDQLTLTRKALKEIMQEQVSFTRDMIDAMPTSNLGTALREEVKSDTEDDLLKAQTELGVLQRLLDNQEGTVSESGDLDDAGQAALAEILGKK